MTVDLARATCRLAGCGGPAAGVCINQLPFDECPDVVPPGDDEPIGAGPLPLEPDIVPTGRSGTLTLEEADAFLRAHGGLVLALVAAPDAGKTTLASASYDLLRRGQLGEFGFAGSETIKGFEERSFDARVASGRDGASTRRTPRGAELVFLHLRVAVPGGRMLDLLISDRSGEHFDRALDAPARFGEFPELARADALLLLVDGEKLATGHQAEIARLRKLVLALAQAGHLAERSVHLVVTKTDRLANAPQRTLVEQRAAVIADELRRRGADTRVELHLTACRARRNESIFGEGVRRLFEANVPPALAREFATTFWVPHATNTSSLDRLMFTARWA